MEFLDEARKKIEDRRREKRERDVSDIRKILEKAEGRRYLWGLMADGGVFHSSFAGAGQNDQTNFNEGMRSLGLRIFSDIMEADPAKFKQMQDEHKSEARKEELRDQEEQKQKEL